MELSKSEQAFGTAARQGPEGGREGRQSYDERLNGILEAATAVIARDGYARASMRAIAAEAGVSLAGLYHYFESKERMLFLIQFRTFGSLLNNLREKLHGVEDPVEQLRVMVRAHVSYFAANMAALKVCSHELDSLTGPAYEETREIRRAYYAMTRDIVGKILADRNGASNGALDLRIATMSLFGTLNWLYRWYHPSRDRAPSVLAGQIASQFLRGLRGEEESRAASSSLPS